MHLVHLTASTFFGGPERQMLGLARHLPADYRSTYLSFAEDGRCAAFLAQVDEAGFEGQSLRCDTPNLRAAIRELTDFLHLRSADVLVCHGYKSNLLGRIAARRAGIPVVSVSRGWTGENWKVSLYERLDRFNLRFMDAVVAVSDGQAAKCRKAGVPEAKLHVVRNAARLDAYKQPDPAYRDKLRDLAKAKGDEKVIVAAGRLSPEKGFDVLVDAAAKLQDVPCRTVLFGEGWQRELLERKIVAHGLDDRFTLAGFRDDLDKWLPWADAIVLPSYTEGLPNVALEASAAGVAVVATAVGGTPEVVEDGRNGLLVPSGDPQALAEPIRRLCRDDALRQRLGDEGKRLMRERFSFESQAARYVGLFNELLGNPGSVRRAA